MQENKCVPAFKIIHHNITCFLIESGNVIENDKCLHQEGPFPIFTYLHLYVQLIFETNFKEYIVYKATHELKY